MQAELQEQYERSMAAQEGAARTVITEADWQQKTDAIKAQLPA